MTEYTSLVSSHASAVSPSASSTGPTYRALLRASYSIPSGPRRPGSPPPVIPDGQEYYWTDEWQAGELETLAELQAGRGQKFDSADEALRFLFEADPD